MIVSDKLPPVARLLGSERLTDKTYEQAKKYFLDLLPDLRAQAEWSISNHSYFDNDEFRPSTNFLVTPVSGMNPFSTHGKCSDPLCRIQNANRFAQTLGLYSDMITIHDPFTTQFIDDDEEWTDARISSLLYDTIVFQELMPLFNKGVIQFLNPSFGFCSSCYEKFSVNVDSLVVELLNDYQSEFKVALFEDGFGVNTGKLYSPSLTTSFPYPNPRQKRMPSKKKIFEAVKLDIEDEIKEILMSCYSTPVQQSAIFSNSRVALNALRSLETSEIPKQEWGNWELAHSTDLPWIKDLSVQQIVQLREEAGSALPQLREKLATNIALNNANVLNASESRSMELVRELRASAEEVSAELKSINIYQERRFNDTAGMLGLTVAIYGYGSDLMAPGMALTTLLSTLGLLHGFSKKDEQEVRKITSKPGYVFVKAKELLKHVD